MSVRYERWKPGDRYDFADEGVEFMEYVDTPERIELSEDNLIDQGVLKKLSVL